MRHDAVAPHNPFATRWVRPGAIPFCFPRGGSLPRTMSRLSALGWRSRITGQHGSGKSTLLAAVMRALPTSGRTACGFGAVESRLPVECCASPPRAWTNRTVVVVDGYDRLSRWSKLRLAYGVKRAGCGLLVTTHAPCRLPLLVRLQPDLQTVLHLVARLLADDALRIRRDEVAASFHRQQGNVREILFDLYDLYERKRR